MPNPRQTKALEALSGAVVKGDLATEDADLAFIDAVVLDGVCEVQLALLDEVEQAQLVQLIGLLAIVGAYRVEFSAQKLVFHDFLKYKCVVFWLSA